MGIFIGVLVAIAFAVLLVRNSGDQSAWLVVEIQGTPVKVKTTGEGKRFVLDRFKVGDKINVLFDAGKYSYDPAYRGGNEGTFQGIWDGEKLVVPDQSDPKTSKMSY